MTVRWDQRVRNIFERQHLQCREWVWRRKQAVIRDNYGHNLLASVSPRYDGIQIDGGVSNVVIDHDTIFNSHNQTSTVMIDNRAGGISNIGVNNNLLVGVSGWMADAKNVFGTNAGWVDSVGVVRGLEIVTSRRLHGRMELEFPGCTSLNKMPRAVYGR
jgi:hypothetical protein